MAILATKLEVLLAVAMSTYYEKSIVLFIPVGKEYVKMLDRLRSLKFVEPISDKHYKLTDKGSKYIRRNDITDFSEVDSEINRFIDNL